MLELKDIKKDYEVAGGAVHALKGISLKFRDSEFVSILGASGCGKTTLLNIIGGLDKYTSGDLIIEGVSTKQYKDGDWDTYRNHSIGFIFQSYHLIPHQTILQNVEIALTISGIDKEERRKRAIKALEDVGLGDKINNKPNQLSGGQAQRVAIARALVNDPEIVLADEPTGALDSKTSVQIMELLKEIAKDRLVIMVTHNPELAEKYSTRIIRLLDGEVVGDSLPYDGQVNVEEKPAKVTEGKKRAAMSRRMAFGLSLKNLLSKGKRTAMVSVAGSIGIIGVSMVLAISAGVQGYINDMENDMLSGYPLSVTQTAIDYEALMDFSTASSTEVEIDRLDDKVYVDSLLDTIIDLGSAMTTNNITYDYKSYAESMPNEYYNAVKWGYDFDIANYIYTDFTSVTGETRSTSVTGIRNIYSSVLGQQEKYADYASLISTVNSFGEMPDNYEYILSQYDIIATADGKTERLSESELKDIFKSEDSLVVILNDNMMSDIDFAQYGYMTEHEFLQFAYKSEGTQDYDQSIIDKYNGMDLSLFVGENAKTFKWYPNDQIYEKQNNIFDSKLPFVYKAYSDDFDEEKGMDLKVKAVLQKKEGISYGCMSSGIYHTKALTDKTIESSKNSPIVNYLNSPTSENHALSMLPFVYDYSYYDENNEVVEHNGRITDLIVALGDGTLQQFIRNSSSHGISFIFDSGSMMDMITSGGGNMYEVGANLLAGSDLPTSLRIYPVDFKTKDEITNYLDKWNEACEAGGELSWTDADGQEHKITLSENDKINYTDTVGLIITMVNTMIQMITVALVAFTALSLVVSTVMVGIITYVSVVERIKEIGILRAVGARKKDIKRLFNAETFIIGLAAGIVGILVTYILSLILNLIVGALSGIYTIAALPVWQALIMIAVSVALTLISGLLPASAAAKKDPVVALRTE